jgi:hypothetical protein
MNGESDDDDDIHEIHVGTAGNSIMSPTPSKLEQDAGSNEFVNVIAPEEEEQAVKGHDIKARTLSVEKMPKPVEEASKAAPITEKAPPIDDDTSPTGPIFTNEMPLQLEPESMTETERKSSLDDDGEDDYEPQMPGSFDMSTAHPQDQTSWAEMLKKLRLQ